VDLPAPALRARLRAITPAPRGDGQVADDHAHVPPPGTPPDHPQAPKVISLFTGTQHGCRIKGCWGAAACRRSSRVRGVWHSTCAPNRTSRCGLQRGIRRRCVTGLAYWVALPSPHRSHTHGPARPAVPRPNGARGFLGRGSSELREWSDACRWQRDSPDIGHRCTSCAILTRWGHFQSRRASSVKWCI
jgi:hypothetical protein